MSVREFLLCAAFVASLVCSGNAQTVGSTVLTGTPPFQTYDGGPDALNEGNLNIHWTFPIMNKPGRGAPFQYSLAYDTSLWTPISVSGASVWQPQGQFGWNTGGTGYYTYTASYSSIQCSLFEVTNGASYFSNFVYYDAIGTAHPFTVSTSTIFTCSSSGGPSPDPTISSATGVSPDGYTIIATGNNAIITTPTGQILTFPYVEYYDPPPTGASSGIFRNGNDITWSNGTFTDTLNTPALTVSGSQSAPPLVMAYPGPSGTKNYQLNYTSYSVQTNFNCFNASGATIAEYGPTATNLPSSLSLPDGRSYNFTYEPTPGFPASTSGRLASVKLPSGGVISYTYPGANDSISCADGSTTAVTRTTPDGGTSYVRSTPSATTSQTLVTHAKLSQASIANQTAITFLISPQSSASFSGGPVTLSPPVFSEIERQDYTGSQASGTLLRTILSCWNAVASPGNCSNTSGETTGAAPVLSYYQPTSRQVTVQWPNSSGIASGYVDQYSGTAVSSHAVYDYGTGGTFSTTPLQTTTTTFVPLAPAGGTLSGNYPTEVKVTDGLGHTIADTQYMYDESTQPAPVASGAPQHITGDTFGNITSILTWVSGSVYQTQHFQYYDDGNVYKATDANGEQTTYSYTGCASAFPTATSQWVGSTNLQTSAAWDCNGAVMTQSTDANGNVTTNNYGSDPLWRVVSVTDPLSNITNYTYPTTSSNASSTSLVFNQGASITGSLVTYDGMGRVLLQQTPLSPGSGASYNTVQTSYNALGQTNCQSISYIALASAAGSAPSNCTTYDALGRPSLYTDSGGGTTQYTYSGNDVRASVGPAPSGENLKQRQLQYNGAGWLTSVCELTSSSISPAGGGCGQNTPASGYLTQYSYDGGGRLNTVQQNVQVGSTGSQARTVTYDGLSRKTSESIPEWSAGTGSAGSSTYTYDADTSGSCGGSSAGDLIKLVDNAGNVTCYAYDAIHRQLSSTVVAGPYASVTPQSYYVYDSAQYNGLAMQNAIGKLAEAYTCMGACSSKLTDEFFSVAPAPSGPMSGGLLTSTWESTPHSGNYLYAQQVSYPNGAVGALSTSSTAPTNTATPGSATLSVTGSDGSNQVCDTTYQCEGGSCQVMVPITTCNTVPDTGMLSVSINGFTSTASYGSGTSDSAIASAIAAGFGTITLPVSASPITASCSGSNVALTAKTTGTASDYSITISNGGGFSITDPNSMMTGGTNAATGTGSSTVGMPNFAFTVDAAGRPYSATDTTNNLNLVTSVGYNAANLPLNLTFGNAGSGGSNDFDTYGYDPNTYRPIASSFNVNPATSPFTIGTSLAWNPNGSLRQMVYTDGNDSTKNQTCAYSADDLRRIASVNCGNSTWAQNFSYDPFGNISKSVPGPATGVSYIQNYATTTNQVTGGVAPSPTYDANGNQLSSSPASLAWNAQAQPISVNSNSAIYDALGRMVESGESAAPTGSFDSGTVTATFQVGVSTCSGTVPYGSGSLPATVAAALANSINASPSCAYLVSASSYAGYVIANALQTQSYTISATSTHSSAYAANSFTATPSVYSIVGANSLSIAITGAEQATSTAPGCSSGGCKEFLFSPSGSILAVVQNGALLKGTLPLPGGDTAIYNASGLNYLRHTDYLNSSRLATTWGHAVYSKVAYAPFGETYNEAGTPDRSFTGQDQDVVAGSAGSGVYDFLFRKYDPSAGRWLSPDPSGWGAVSLSAPQSLNRYAYVQNNPMQAVDPTGLDCLYLNSNGSVTVGANYDCPTDSNGNPTDNGYFIDATNVVGGTFDSNGNLTAIFSGASVDVNAYGDMGPTLLGISAGGAVGSSGGTPWYKSCGAQATGSFLLHGSIDAIGAIPGEGVIAAGFSGGKAAFQAVQFGSGLAATAYGVGDKTTNGKVASGLGYTGIAVGLAGKKVAALGLAKGVAELIPGIGIGVAVASVLWDGYSAVSDYMECTKEGH